MGRIIGLVFPDEQTEEIEEISAEDTSTEDTEQEKKK